MAASGGHWKSGHFVAAGGSVAALSPKEQIIATVKKHLMPGVEIREAQAMGSGEFRVTLEGHGLRDTFRGRIDPQTGKITKLYNESGRNRRLEDKRQEEFEAKLRALPTTPPGEGIGRGRGGRSRTSGTRKRR